MVQTYLSLLLSLCAQWLQSCPTLCYPMDCSSSGSSIYGIFPARTLERVAIPSPPRDLLYPGMEPMSPSLQTDSLLLSYWGSPTKNIGHYIRKTQFEFLAGICFSIFCLLKGLQELYFLPALSHNLKNIY